MKRTYIIRGISLIMVLALVFTTFVEKDRKRDKTHASAATATASPASAGIAGAKAGIDYINKKKADLEKTLSDLESGKKDIIKYIEKLDKKITKITGEINEVKAKITDLNNSIRVLKADIKTADEDIADQYEIMKKRIKYMYERGNADYIDILLESTSIADFLNRSEYIEKISEYDKNMLGRYVAAKEELENKKASLEEKKEELKVEKQALKLEKEALLKVADKKEEELKEYEKKISKADSQMEQYDNELIRQEQILAEAIAERQREIEREEAERRAAEEAARKAAEEAARKEEEEKNAAATAEPSESAKGSKKSKATPTPAPAAGSRSASASGFTWPLAVSGTITSRFGSRTSPTRGASTYHEGIDISASAGTSILAAKAGTVVSASYSSAAGNYVMISHGDGVYTIYMHASSLNVSVGQKVSQGETIAYVGSTGISTGNHLHFGVSVNGTYVNPEDYVSR